jgi:CAAX protease family protein
MTGTAQHRAASSRERVGGPLAAFVVSAYVLSWAWILPIALSGGVVEQGSGWPTHFPALLGPMVAGLLVAARTGRLRALLADMARFAVPTRWWLAALSPLVVGALALLVAAAAGADGPPLSAWGVFAGLPAAWGPVGVTVVLVVVNGFGEEAGWRGFALPLLQRRFSPLTSMLLLTAIWAAWHAPMFLVVSTMRGFGTGTTVGWLVGLAAGSVVLGWMRNRSGSVAVVAVWHGLFNVVSGTAAAAGLLAALNSTAVMLAAAVLVGAELLARRRGRPSVLGPAGRAAPAGRGATASADESLSRRSGRP